MDGTLLASEAMMIDCALATLEAMGHPPRREALVDMVGVASNECDVILRRAFGPDLDLELFERHWRAEAARRWEAGVPLRPGVEQLLETLNAKGMPMAVATNSRTQSARDDLTRAGIIGHFGEALVFGRDAVPRPKPAPDMFLAAARALGAAPDRAVVFEDSETGVAAAVAAGIAVVQVPDQRPAQTDTADLIATTILDGARQIGLIS